YCLAAPARALAWVSLGFLAAAQLTGLGFLALYLIVTPPTWPLLALYLGHIVALLLYLRAVARGVGAGGLARNILLLAVFAGVAGPVLLAVGTVGHLFSASLVWLVLLCLVLVVLLAFLVWYIVTLAQLRQALTRRAS